MARRKFAGMRLSGRGGRSRWLEGIPPLLLVLAGFGLLSYLQPEVSLSDLLLGKEAASSQIASYAQRSFPICTSSQRVTCVVDGDTFWLDGVKIRIADINTPEVSQPDCAAEATLGARATSRMAQLLATGPFDLQMADRDEDQYGRKLRVVWRDGRSLGDTLVQEGLAHPWRGRRESWC